MRLCVRVAMLIGVGLGLAGCSTARKPILVIAPSYSYVQADLARSVNSNSPARSTQSSAFAKLPPLPPAPLFDPLVYRGQDKPFE